jgi:hypothetical protein
MASMARCAEHYKNTHRLGRYWIGGRGQSDGPFSRFPNAAQPNFLQNSFATARSVTTRRGLGDQWFALSETFSACSATRARRIHSRTGINPHHAQEWMERREDAYVAHQHDRQARLTVEKARLINDNLWYGPNYAGVSRSRVIIQGHARSRPTRGMYSGGPRRDAQNHRWRIP